MNNRLDTVETIVNERKIELTKLYKMLPKGRKEGKKERDENMKEKS